MIRVMFIFACGAEMSRGPSGGSGKVWLIIVMILVVYTLTIKRFTLLKYCIINI